ncbi:hypothetical protein KUCAC02_026181 [Chaenocephalus aceratus]|uniref:Uncharacterized protein n=1 Tax=Chaenocephalus aceratus TaxID=36190 RepID=A0ACB9VWM8_CHAAC|nr:hypothetical protein KUCAC02_026181 [Chaenocephalus aceratus]
MGATSQIVSVLASTMSSPSTTAIFVDNFFTSLELVRYLRDQNCRYTGTARDNRIGKPPLKSIKEMEKKAVPRGKCDYIMSDDGILAVRWKDNRTVYLLSTDMGVEPMSSVIGYCSETKTKEPLQNSGVQGCQQPVKSSSRRSSSSLVESVTVADPQPVRGHRSHTPNVAVRFDPSLFHAPVHANRLTCKYCSRKGNIVRSNVVCRVCKVHLCMNAEHNFFVRYHEEFD